MILNDAVIEFNLTGICKIDIDKAVKAWTNKCFISRWGNEYRLIRVKNKNKYALKVGISIKDAKELIKKLELIEHKSDVFNFAFTYKVV